MDRADEVADLRDDVDRVAQRFEHAVSAAKGPFFGKDRSGSVTVAANKVGHIQEVRVSASWRSDLESAELGAAVLDAYLAAGIARVKDWGTSLAEEMVSPRPSIRPLPPFRDSISAQLEEVARSGMSPEETQAIMDSIAEFLREVSASIDEASDEVARVQRTEVRGVSEGGHVQVTASGTGDLKEIRYDEAWLERAHVVNIGRETVLAQQAALRAIQGRGVADVVASTRLGQLQALASDPVAFARHVGLSG
jgi:DNA-binding protein YbaB